jgi:3-hydroxyisobutyrate dehydrogenase-like beta-hydroxyacid dehydrogenase
MVKKDYLPAQGTFEAHRIISTTSTIAKSTGSATPLFSLAADLFKRGVERGLAQRNVAAIIEVVRDLSSEEKHT